MRQTFAIVLTVTVVVLLLPGCQQTLGPNGLLVGFGPVIDGKATGYCGSDSPILGYETGQKILRSPMPRLKDPPKGQNREAAEPARIAACLERTIAEVSPGLRVIINLRSLEASGATGDQLPEVRPEMTVEMALRACYGDVADVRFANGKLLIASRDQLNSELSMAWYPVTDLVRRTRTPNYAAETNQYDHLKDIIQKTVHSAVDWDSAGGRATLDFDTSRGLMIVAQTPEGHLMLARLLASLRVLSTLHQQK